MGMAHSCCPYHLSSVAMAFLPEFFTYSLSVQICCCTASCPWIQSMASCHIKWTKLLGVQYGKNGKHLFILAKKQNRNEYAKCLLFQLFSRLFHTGFAVPLMQFWMRVVLGARIRGKGNLRGLRGALTVCNHVHFLDSVMVSLALFPRKAVFPTFAKNVKPLKILFL